MKNTTPIALTLAALTCSCGTLFQRPALISLTSDPPGARWSTDQGQSGTTPAVICPALQSEPVTVTFELDGHAPQVQQLRPKMGGMLGANLLLGPVAPLGFIVDWGRPESRELTPRKLHVDFPAGN
jgi:hypothetical protein